MKSWAFMKDHMPGVIKLLREKRQAGKGAYIDACWRHGVVQGEPGWFFASEGGVSIGALWPDAAQAALEQRAMTAAVGGLLAPLLVLRPEVVDGAH